MAHDHDHDSAYDPLKASCACCRGGETPAGAAEPDPDPATRSLSRALTTSFRLLKVSMLVLVGLFLFDCVATVQEGEAGLVRRFGAYLRTPSGEVRTWAPGLVFVWPAPIEKLERVRLREPRTLRLDAEFWPQDPQAKAESLKGDSPTAPVREKLDPAKDGSNLTGDFNLLHSRWTLQYRIADPVAWKTAAVDPEGVLRHLSAGVILRSLANLPVDAVLLQDESLGRTLLERIRAETSGADGRPIWGVEVTSVSGAAVPPGKIKAAFDEANGALSEKRSRVDQARAEARQILEGARQEANRVRQDALVYRKRIVEKARADAEAVRAFAAKFPGDPAGLRIALEQARLGLVREVLAGARVLLLRPGERTVFITSPPPATAEPEKGRTP